MSVRISVFRSIAETTADDSASPDFLALRKIPLRPESYIRAQADVALGESSTAPLKAETIDPAALGMQRAVQDIVLEDRDLADKVSPPSCASIILPDKFHSRPPKPSSQLSAPTPNTKPLTSSVCETSMSSAWAPALGCSGSHECPRYGTGRTVLPRPRRGSRRARPLTGMSVWWWRRGQIGMSM